VGDVGLPRLVGQLGFEADQRGARALLRLGDHQALTAQDPPDRRDRGSLLALPGEMVGDRLRAAVTSSGVQLGLERGALERGPRAS